MPLPLILTPPLLLLFAFAAAAVIDYLQLTTPPR